MSDDLNNDSGKISGKSKKEISPSGKIAGSTTVKGPVKNADDPVSKKEISTRQDRIAAATEEKGLKSLPQNFGDSDGDWHVIESDNLFEVLFIDFNQIILINPDIVENNVSILVNFWKAKKNLWESGSGQVRKSIEDKYGEKNLNTCIKKIEYAAEQLSTIQKINEYYLKYREQRIKIAEDKLEPLFRMMLKDGEAEPSEMENILDEGLIYNLNEDEIATIIKKTFEAKGFKPYTTPKGDDLKEQLLSVSWMTEERAKVKKLEDEEKKKRGREIFENKFAYNVEDIGEILFNNEEEARQYIKDGLLVNSIDYFSPVKAKQCIEITKTKGAEYQKYLQIVYKLNSTLPFRFSKNLTHSTSELCSFLAENLESLKLGKEHFKQGNIEIWLQETHKDDYLKFVKIRDTAENADLAFLEFLYTFNPKLPYRFNHKILVTTKEELCSAINQSDSNWKAGKKELFDSSILVWLKAVGNEALTEDWGKIKAKYSDNENIGLEKFLHLLETKLILPKIKVDKKSLSFPKIQNGDVITASLLFENETRGYTEGELSFSSLFDGVSLSSQKISFSAAEGKTSNLVTVAIDSRMLQKGLPYEMKILVKSTVEQKIEIPLTFKIIFPKRAFILEVLKYAAILTPLFGLTRLIISGSYPGWLKTSFNFFLDSGTHNLNYGTFSVFGWAFLFFIVGVLCGGYFLIKFLVSKKTEHSVIKKK